jgi:hypothetical protein
MCKKGTLKPNTMKNIITSFTILIISFITVNPIISQTQIGDDIEGKEAFELSGWSVSLSSDGSRVAVGVPGNPEFGPYIGHVRVYEWVGG